MKTLAFSVEIKAKPEKIWNVLWSDTYTKWTEPFTKGCYYETSSFSEGNEIRFLAPGGDGMLSKIVSLKPIEFVAFEHVGILMNGEITFFKEKNDNQHYLETYQLVQHKNAVILTAKVDTLDPWEVTLNTTFPKALEIIKELAES